MAQLDLALIGATPIRDSVCVLGPGAVLLPGSALKTEDALLAALDQIAEQAAFSHMTTPGGYRMSVAMTNLGKFGWVSDVDGYRYADRNPQTGRPWPALPACFQRLAQEAALSAGYPNFIPDACLVNHYAPGARLTLHQDKNERDFSAPIVSVSLGIPALFLFGGASRSLKPQRVPLYHGDVVVWGGPTRLAFHGVMPIKDAVHPRLGALRINLTFRKAGPA